LSSTKILYRHHPCYGLEVEVIRHLRRSSSAILIVRLPDGVQLAVPEWMLNPQVCQYLTDQPEARIAIEALAELRNLVDSQTFTSDRLTSGRAESSAGGNHAQQQKAKRRAVATPVRGLRNLGRASRAGAGTLSQPLAPVADKRSGATRGEAK
jgi:hypothetical protein